MFGVPSPEMERFLLNDLTDTGLKKLRHSIELSYTNIQSLVLRHLQPAALRIADYLLQVSTAHGTRRLMCSTRDIPRRCLAHQRERDGRLNVGNLGWGWRIGTEKSVQQKSQIYGWDTIISALAIAP